MKNKENRWSLKGIMTVFILFVVALIAEVFVFNYRHFESMENKEIADYQLSMGDGFKKQPDGTYLIEEGDKTLEFTEIDTKLNTLYIDIELIGQEKHNKIVLFQAARDDSHEEYYRIPDGEIWHTQEKSQYMTYHFYGNCKSLKITPQVEEEAVIKIDFALNPVIPMFYSWVRVAVLYGAMLFFYVFRPSAQIHQIKFMEMKKGKAIIPTILLLINMLLLYRISGLNPFFQTEHLVQQKEYQTLAEAFAKGQVYLDVEPTAALKAMENPYDYEHRALVLSKAGESFLWDHAYFEGKYYVYFGVVPVILFYLPYYLITGIHLHNYQVILAGTVLFLTAIMGILYEIVKRWFPKVSTGCYILIYELLILGSGVFYMCKRPDLYTVPIIWGLAFGFAGFWSFLCAERESRLSPKHMGIGSLCTALVAGCRPQLFLIVLFSVLLFSKYFFDGRYLKTTEGKCALVSYVFPMMTVAAFLMWYNYVRFGSVFDFGANYNLSFNDMRGRGFVPDRIPLGIWAYLFAPIKIVLDFPFIEANFFDSNYLGVTISESTYGGIFATNLLVWICPILVAARKYIKQKKVMLMSFVSMAIGLIIVVADTEMSGILMRYFSDFTIFFLFAGILAWLLIYDRLNSDAIKRTMILFLIICVLTMVIYQGLIFFLDTGEALKDLRPDLFSFVKYQVMFWL